MATPYDQAIDLLRRSAAPTAPAPAAMEPYLTKVRDGAYRVVDRDIDELRSHGLSEDEIFEQTVSTAVAAGLARLDAALRAVT